MTRDVFYAIADPTRRAILTLIATQALTPNVIAQHFDLTRQAVSNHIGILAECELLHSEKRGREIHYNLNPDKLKDVDVWLERFRGMWQSRFEQLDDVLSKMKTKKRKK